MSKACDALRPDISARLDDEVDRQRALELEAHIESCPSCSAYEERMRATRRALRVHTAERVPDLREPIMARIRTEHPRVLRRREWVTGARVGAVAAAVAALVVLASSIPFSDRQPQSASATEIVAQVREAAEDLDSYRATFSIIERGYPAGVKERRFNAQVFYEAPERFRLRVRDLTTYPDPRWPANDIDLVARPRQWWVEQPRTCPAEVLLECPLPQGTSERTVVERQPFDGTSTLPTDIIVPLETLASSGDFEISGSGNVIGRPAVKVTMPYREALPLVGALQPAGLWREFHPLDRVDIWLDEATWFPLRFEVRADDSEGRAAWARLEGYRDSPGRTVLEVGARRFSRKAINPKLFSVPSDGTIRTGDFVAAPKGADWIEPSYTAGLDPYRRGLTPDGRWVSSWARGMTWLKLTGGGRGGASVLPASAEQVRLAGGGSGYYQPATESLKRRFDLFSTEGHLHLESNLARSELIEVATSLGVTGERIPRVVKRSAGTTVTRLLIEEAFEVDFVARPMDLPDGYRPRAAVLTTSRQTGDSVTIYFRRTEAEYAADGIRITQSLHIKALVPSSESSVAYDLDGLEARWFSERGELEWIDEGVYRSVTVPSGDLATAYRIARSLR